MQLSLQFGYFKHLITFVPCFDVKYVTNHFPPSMINSYFTNNTVNRDGGAINMDSGTVSNCNFTNNTASGNGGAVWIYSGNVTNCNFVNNTASGWGGAIRFSGTGTVTNCNFIVIHQIHQK